MPSRPRPHRALPRCPWTYLPRIQTVRCARKYAPYSVTPNGTRRPIESSSSTCARSKKHVATSPRTRRRPI
ncbi:hypothetical protein HYQ44_009787 [Verticillium longisporum]|nr:hypothetical protein HYQ44_009787 [Verticillium longisporum]